MNLVTKRKSAQYMIWAFVILMMLIIIGLYGMPFLSAKVDDSIYVDKRNASNTFELMEKAFNFENFRFSNYLSGDTVFRELESDQILKAAFNMTFTAGVVYWLMLIPMAFCVINSVILLIFKRGLSNIAPTATLAGLSFINLMLFFASQLKYNQFFELLIPDYGANKYFYYSNAPIIFAFAFIALGVSIAHAVLVKKKVFEAIPIFVKRVSAEVEPNEKAMRAQQAKIDLNPLDFAKNAIFEKVGQIELKQRFKEVERLLGNPKFVNDLKTAFWWRNSDTMEEYLLRVSSMRADRQICIEVDESDRVKSIYYNADGTTYKEKTVKEKHLLGKEICYNARNFLLELGTLSVEVLFTDGSFIRKSDVKLEIGKTAEGKSTVKWHIDELEYEDTIDVQE